MKRFIVSVVVLLLLATPFSVSAQRNTVTGAMIIHNTDIIKSKKEKKQFAAVDIKKGYQQEVSFAYSAMFHLGSMFNFNYIGGWRFNRYFYAGIGTGLDFSGYNEKQFIGEYKNDYIIGRSCIKNIDFVEEEIGKKYPESHLYLSNQVLAIPLYAHLRIYFMKTKWTPFLAFSAGARFSASKKLDVYEGVKDPAYSWSSTYYIVGDYIRTEKYGAVTGMFEVMPGVSYQYSKDMAFNFQLGYATRGCRGNWGNQGKNREIEKHWAHGFTIRFGVVF